MAEEAVYGYDSLGRLINVTFSNGAMATYRYDDEGNRTTVVTVPAALPPPAGPVQELPKRSYGDQSFNPMVVLLSTGELVGWGDDTTGALANGQTVGNGYNSLTQRVTFDPNTTVPPPAASISDWALIGGNLYVIFSNGWAYSAGANNYGQLAHGDVVPRPWLKRIEFFVTNNHSITKVWAGGSLSTTFNGGCAFFLDSANILYGVGINTVGNLGNAANPTTNLTTPAACAGVSQSPFVVAVEMSSFGPQFSTFLVMSDNTVLVAGNNANSQLGIGSTVNQTGTFVNAKTAANTPVSNCVKLRANGNTTEGCSTILLDTAGMVWGTGLNAVGELGLGTTTPHTFFTKSTFLSKIAHIGITGNPAYAYGLDTDSVLWTWGWNAANNMFRNNTTSPQPTPAAVPPSNIPGTVLKVFLPRGEGLGTNAQMIVQTTSGLLAFAGAATGQFAIPNTTTPGAYFFIPMPKHFLDGTETIQDIFIHGTGATQRWFILSKSGNLYACGQNASGICTGGIASAGTSPVSVAWCKIDNF